MADIQAEIDRYLAAFKAANGEARQPPSDFRYRNGWLTYRHYGITHRTRRAFLTEAADRLEQQSRDALS